MHVLAKFFARPGLEEAVIEAIGRILEVRRPDPHIYGRAITCQRDDRPNEIIYVAPVNGDARLEERLAAANSELASALERPIDIRWCKVGSSFRRWGLQTAVLGVLVIRVAPEHRDEVARRYESSGLEHRDNYAGMIGYRLMYDLHDPGFVAIEQEWKSEEALAQFRRDARTSHARWVTEELGGRVTRYGYRVRAMFEPTLAEDCRGEDAVQTATGPSTRQAPT